jgi:hypothetical protein
MRHRVRFYADNAERLLARETIATEARSVCHLQSLGVIWR